jgi:hypothetical protein
MDVFWIVMRPMNNRRFAGIVHHLSPNLHVIAGRQRDARCDIDVIDHLDISSGRVQAELFVNAMRVSSIEKRRFRGNHAAQIGHVRAPFAGSFTHVAAGDKPCAF